MNFSMKDHSALSTSSSSNKRNHSLRNSASSDCSRVSDFLRQSAANSTPPTRPKATIGADSIQFSQMDSHDMIAMLEMYAENDNATAVEAFQHLKNSPSPANTSSSSGSRRNNSNTKKRTWTKSKKPSLNIFGRSHAA